MPGPEAVGAGSLILVNAAHAYRENAQSISLERAGLCRSVLLERRANTLLSQLMAQIDGWNGIVAVSGWRSREEQQRIWDSTLREQGAAFAAQYVAKPGHSEHQTGLAIDLGKNGPEVDFLRPAFPNEGICRTFRRLAARYGFVLRYPKGKEEITGIAYEPWHFRYVGVPHAQIMEERGLVLEEYLEFLRAYRFGEKSFVWNSGALAFRISYLASDAEQGIPEGGETLYQLSGDNVGGFVATQWGTGYGM